MRFEGGQVWLGDDDVTEAIRTEEAGMNASRVSALPLVRKALIALQHSFARLPGLVADGRDMGTVIFPGADLKIYLTASAAPRAERRYKQLISKGISANIVDLRADLEARDARDHVPQRRALEARARRSAAGQLRAHDRRDREPGAQLVAGAPAFRPGVQGGNGPDRPAHTAPMPRRSAHWRCGFFELNPGGFPHHHPTAQS